MTNLSLQCRCGEVKATATNVSSSAGTRVVCCCSDCQAFATYLGKEDETLDDFGGTEIYQMALSELSVQQGQDKLKSMRLRQKGLLRWYSSCCNTPIGNTMSASMPFVGVIHTFVDHPDRESVMGPVRAFIQTQDAKGEPSYPKHSAKFPMGITARIARKLLLWKIQGKSKPSAFFDDDGRPVVKPVIASDDA